MMLLALAGCTGTTERDAPSQRYIPPNGQLALTISGHLEETAVDRFTDETITIKVNDRLAALGGFQASQGVGEGNFIGAYGGDRIDVHCTKPARDQGLVCDVAVAGQHAATLDFGQAK